MRADPLHPQVAFNVQALSCLNDEQRQWLIDREREDYRAHIESEIADLNRLREAIRRHEDRIKWCGDVRVADERSAEIAKLKHQADLDLWRSVAISRERGRDV